ncbi:MAG: hypothetical protein ACTHLZ_17810 [Tepidisphaeraceae bacterium]
MSIEQLENINRMSGEELRDLVERGVDLPNTARLRLLKWQAAEFRLLPAHVEVDVKTRRFRSFLIDSLRSLVCPGCDGRKGERKSFCADCYRLLPAGLKADLYRSIGHGYEKAFASSMDKLSGRTGK